MSELVAFLRACESKSNKKNQYLGPFAAAESYTIFVKKYFFKALLHFKILQNINKHHKK
jgi:hypothetical protein